VADDGFKTVPDELLEHAEAVADRFREHGYSVKVEPVDPSYPYTPTLRCRRSPTRVFVEVRGSLSMERAEEWSRFGRSCTTDTRVVIATPESVARTNAEDARLQELGIGVFVSTASGVREALAAHDLAINVQLPELASLPRKIRKCLGPVYEEFGRSHWREAFDDACQVLQIESAKYLKKSLGSGRVTVCDTRGRRRKVTGQMIDRMTLGQLGVAFANIQVPNHPDKIIAAVLNKVNKDRVGVAHQKGRRLTEERLRRNVGQHMYRVISALKAALEVT
jgi:hypothetical protein